MSLLFRYKFRIKAENDYGASEPGPESDPFDVAGGASAAQQAIDRYCQSLRCLPNTYYTIPLLPEDDSLDQTVSTNCATELGKQPSGAVNQNLETATCG